MRILHYSLGLPPYRSGGLTKYSTDVMVEQAKQGEEVYLLFPGKMNLFDKPSKIRYFREYKKVKVYELINPLPVSLLRGVRHPERFMTSCDVSIFVKILKDLEIEVVHIHTLMGIHIEFFVACKQLGIKIFYTTHDYYGLCTKASFFDSYNGTCKDRHIEKCLKCNSCGHSINIIKIMQSSLYRLVKSTGAIGLIKAVCNRPFLKRNKKKEDKITFNSVIDREYYEKLLRYYEEIFKKIDYYLFNSSLTKSVYEKYLKVNGQVVSITHSHIKDRRVIREYNNKGLRLTYLGPTKEYKGFSLIINLMKEIETAGYKDVKLNCYGDISLHKSQLPTNVKLYGRYKYCELERIFNETDLLIVPSIWNETFGFATLEAISYGVTVVVTETVGSKDILLGKAPLGFVVKGNCKDLVEVIESIVEDKIVLKELNHNIVNADFNYNITQHCIHLKSIIESEIKRRTSQVYYDEI